MTGPDTWSFLQAIVSADLDPLTDGTGTDCLLLAPQGKLDVAFRLLRIDAQTAAVDCDPGLAPRLVESLLRYRIRVKAEVFDATGDLALISFVGADAPAPPVALPDALHASRHRRRAARGAHPGTATTCSARWRPSTGSSPSSASSGVVEAVPEAYEAWRIDHGIAVQPFDLDESIIPQEAFLERDAVSFTKGCFIGQELVCRIDTRGHVNRFLRVLDVQGDDPPPVGAVVEADGREVGSLTSVTPSGVPVVALGLRAPRGGAARRGRAALGRRARHRTAAPVRLTAPRRLR